jgi:hypothetical protein
MIFEQSVEGAIFSRPTFQIETALSGCTISTYGDSFITVTITLLHNQYLSCCVKSEVFTAVNVKNAVFWDIKTQFVPHRRQLCLR